MQKMAICVCLFVYLFVWLLGWARSFVHSVFGAKTTVPTKILNLSSLIRKFIFVCALGQSTIIICNKFEWNIVIFGFFFSSSEFECWVPHFTSSVLNKSFLCSIFAANPVFYTYFIDIVTYIHSCRLILVIGTTIFFCLCNKYLKISSSFLRATKTQIHGFIKWMVSFRRKSFIRMKDVKNYILTDYNGIK